MVNLSQMEFMKNLTSSALDEDAAFMQAIAQEAGQIALRSFKKNNLQKWHKGDNTLACQADIEVNDFLFRKLTERRPDYGWLSEETKDDHQRLKAESVWVVDPIDGTRAFIEGRDDWCISIALVVGNRPVLGVIYSPVNNEQYFAQLGMGAFLNGVRIQTSRKKTINQIHLMANRSELSSHGVLSLDWPADMKISYLNSIALRIAWVASGKADICFTLKPKNEWDLAAADIILSEAGGILTNQSNIPLVYNQRLPNYKYIIAGTIELHAALNEILSPIVGKK